MADGHTVLERRGRPEISPRGTLAPPADQERPVSCQSRARAAQSSEWGVGEARVWGTEADSVTSAEQSSDMRPDIGLESKATLSVEFLALSGTFSKRVNK